MTQAPSHILIVDDNEYNRELLVQDLEDHGYQVATASNGIEALEAIERSLPSMVLLDIMMPGLSGLQVCEILRTKRRTQDLPVIMVTAKADSQDVVAGLRTGANDYITKPIDLDVLLARMGTHLKLRELQTDARRQNDRLMRELSAARTVQESLLPGDKKLAEFPRSYGIEVDALWRPCEMLGGDFWDTVALADGSLALLLIDFAGTGVAPSLNTFRIKTFVQSQCVGLYNPALALARLNAHLLTVLGPYELATGIYARYNPDRMQLTACAAGAPPPLVFRARTQEVEEMRLAGYPLGAIANAEHEESSVVLEPGDKVLMMTDGLFKCASKEKGMYTPERVKEFLAFNGTHRPKELIERLKDDLISFCAESPLTDDVTVVALEVLS